LLDVEYTLLFQRQYVIDNERWSDQKTVSGDGKFNLFSVAEIRHCIGLFHNT